MNKKLTLSLIVIFMLCTMQLFAQGNSDDEGVRKTVISNGVGLGSVIAVVASWSRSKSILWAILHGIFSWLYVIYFAVTRTTDNEK